ncbi:MAG: 1-deoxy-D-xylulose-5-phosphate reductoisomerase [bacterium]|nr:1-deoxy-D-xylulose-5-phosphate reductoisomerase [bacterium]
MKRILLQGSTGSIGLSALDVLAEQNERFAVVGLCAGSKEAELLAQAERLKPASIALLKCADATSFRARASEVGVARCYTGPDAFVEQARDEEYDVLLNAVMGGVGIRPTLVALERGHNVALANKETLVAAGELVMHTARLHNAAVLPIDSEHSALQQCLVGEHIDDVARLWLTTSGGPFFGQRPGELSNVTARAALAHPTWQMGPKITIDSATLFNKGLEVIEACRLFDLPVAKVGVVRQRESVIHSLVEFVDGSFKGQMSRPDMRLPILYALSYPRRFPSSMVRGNPADWGTLHLEPVEIADYPCLRLAFEAVAAGGTTPAVLSAADEIAVQAFLADEIRFTDIADVIDSTITAHAQQPATDIETILAADRWAREFASRETRRRAEQHTQVTC